MQLGTQSNLVRKNQRFNIVYKGNGYYEIKSQYSGKSLDVAGAGIKNGTNVQQYSANGSDAQRWIIQDNNDGTYSICSKANYLYLDIACGTIKNKTNIQMYEGNGSNAQKFKLEKVEKPTCKQVLKDGVYEIRTALNSNKVLDISGGNKNDSANLQIWSTSNVQQQKFQVTYKQEGYYEIKALHSGKVLDVAGGSSKSGTNVQQYTENGTDAQKWILQDAGSGYFYIMSRGAESYLDVAGASTQDGTNVQIYDANQTAAQKFKFKNIGVLHGIDVSEHNKLIDWRTVKQSGEVEFAIIRCGYGGNITSQDDIYFERNVLECERLKIPYGIYLYSYAGTKEGAKSEAEHVLRLIKGKNPTYGIWIDIEDTDGYKAKNNIPYETGAEVADEFCKVMKASGYSNVGIYANLNWFDNYLNNNTLNKYPKWVAEWETSKCNYNKPFVMWQYSDCGKIQGITGMVDMDLYYN